MKATFPYTPVALPRGAASQRPMLKVKLRAANGQYYDSFGLVDSGADACLFPLRMARFLKPDLANLPRALTSGVGSSANVTYYANITFELDHGLSFEALAGFTEGMDRISFGLLGQSGFFENFNVEFRHRERRFTVETS